MLYTAADIQEYVEENDVKFIRLAFCDSFGVQKNISIMPGELARAFDAGISFDASAIADFGGEEKSDLFLQPDPTTLALLPWRPSHGRVARMFCWIRYPDGSPFALDSRAILRGAVRAARDAGYGCNVGAECEFYLFKTDENGEPTRIPFDTAGYMDIAPQDKGENVRREICLALEEMGILPESSHHEEGPGQNEIDFRYSDPLRSADDTLTFRAAVATIAARNGLYATFEPKPLPEHSGNGFHINLSPYRLDGTAESGVFDHFLAGILRRVQEITAFLNPGPASYERLGGCKAPQYVTWSPQNRSQLVRIPAAAGVNARIELRSPDPTANPYLAYALILHAGLEGIADRAPLPEPVNCNLYTAPAALLDRLARLPGSFAQAVELACGSAFVRAHLPERLLQSYRRRAEERGA